MTLERLLYELYQPEFAAAAAVQLVDFPCPEAAAALCSLIQTASSAEAAIAAIDTCLSFGADVSDAGPVLSEEGGSVALPHVHLDALVLGCRSHYSSVRQRAAMGLGAPEALPLLLGLLTRDPAWIVRQAALVGVAASIERLERGPHSVDWCLRVIDCAIDDPHWRVRNDLLQLILRWTEEARLTLSELIMRYDDVSSPQVVGMVRYLTFLRALASGQTDPAALPTAPSPLPPLEIEGAPWWSDDPPLLRSRIAALSRASWRQWLADMLPLLSHESAGVRRLIAGGLRRHGDATHWIELLERLDEPRSPHLVALASPLLEALNEDRREALCLQILGWGLDTNQSHDPRLSDEHDLRPLATDDERLWLDGWLFPVASPFALKWALSQPLPGWCEGPEEALSARPLTLPLLIRCVLSSSLHPSPAVALAAVEAMGQILSALSQELSGTAHDAVNLDATERAVATRDGLIAAIHARLEVLATTPTQSAGTTSSGYPLRERGDVSAQDVALAAWQTLAPRLSPEDAELLLPKTPSLAWELAHARYLDDAGTPLSAAETRWQRWAVATAPALREIAARVLAQRSEDDIWQGQPGGVWGGLLGGLQRDPVPSVRAAALTKARALQICGAPEEEPLWLVRKRAARRCRVPFVTLIPPAPGGSEEGAERRERDALTGRGRPDFPVPDVIATTPHRLARPLGKSGLSVTPLGVSGHYGLPEAGFAQALDAGVNLFFWEPSYNTQTRFFQALSPAYKAELVTVAGTFESEPKAILRDLERALKSQQLEQIKLWLIFWVRDWERLSPEVIALLEECKAQGKIHTYGMSTHQRPLAVKAITSGWDVVMVRHNAAHRGAEDRIFPAALAHGTGLLTFNNLIYGRILQALAAAFSPPTASECYRYCLSQPGVCGSWTAPYDLEQLSHNLSVLDDLALSEERVVALRRFGDLLYRKNRMFSDCVRDR